MPGNMARRPVHGFQSGTKTTIQAWARFRKNVAAVREHTGQSMRDLSKRFGYASGWLTSALQHRHMVTDREVEMSDIMAEGLPPAAQGILPMDYGRAAKKNGAAKKSTNTAKHRRGPRKPNTDRMSVEMHEVVERYHALPLEAEAERRTMLAEYAAEQLRNGTLQRDRTAMQTLLAKIDPALGDLPGQQFQGRFYLRAIRMSDPEAQAQAFAAMREAKAKTRAAAPSAEEITTLMEGLKDTPGVFATRLGVRPSTLDNWLRGSTSPAKPAVDKMRALQRVLRAGLHPGAPATTVPVVGTVADEVVSPPPAAPASPPPAPAPAERSPAPAPRRARASHPAAAPGLSALRPMLAGSLDGYATLLIECYESKSPVKLVRALGADRDAAVDMMLERIGAWAALQAG